MSLRILVDEDSQSRRLVALLREAGHDVLTVNEAGLAGATDEAVLARATEESRVTLTANVGDFRGLHGEQPRHVGILGIFHDDDPSKDMSREDIVRAIANLEEASVQIKDSFFVLNAWNW